MLFRANPIILQDYALSKIFRAFIKTYFLNLKISTSTANFHIFIYSERKLFFYDYDP
jgi:hypothetical protein